MVATTAVMSKNKYYNIINIYRYNAIFGYYYLFFKTLIFSDNFLGNKNFHSFFKQPWANPIKLFTIVIYSFFAISLNVCG
jgi:hypothetical protein